MKSTNPDLEAQIKATPDGMAHWAGSGPDNRSCRECNFFEGRDYYANGGGLKPAPCRKYQMLRNGRRGGRIPWYTKACKYFEENPYPPPRH
jgi:hypothetical protein